MHFLPRRRLQTKTKTSGERGEVASWLILAAVLALVAAGLQTIVTPQIQALAARIGGGEVAVSSADEGDFQGPALETNGDEDPVDAPTERASETLAGVVATIDHGDDFDISEGDLDDIHDDLAELTDEELAFVLANLTDEQLARLFHNVHSDSFWSNDWNDRERREFYDNLLRGDLFEVLSRLSPEQRQQISEDNKLMDHLEQKLSTDEYLDLLTTLNTDHSSGELPSATETDALIRAFIDEDYLDGPIADGKEADGNLAIVDAETFEQAWDAEIEALIADQIPNASEAEKDLVRQQYADVWLGVNGFLDSQGRQWIKTTANPGTPIHEAIHFYSDPALNERSNQLNEGVTEYFTRQVLANTDDPSTPQNEAQETLDQRVYDTNERFVQDLVDVVGEEAVAAAYFDGDLGSLQHAYIEATGRTEADFNTMLDLISIPPSPLVPIPDAAWDAATDLLEPATP